MTNVARITLAILLVAAAFTIAMAGEAAMPAWIIGLSIKAGFVPEFGARITVGLSAALAGILLALGRRGRVPAILVAGLVLFSGVADLSASFSLGEGAARFIRPSVQIVVGLGILVTLLRTEADPKRLRHPLMAGFGVIVSLALGSAIAANVEVAVDVQQLQAGRDADGRFIVNDLTASLWESWEGLPIEETDVLEYLPQLRALVLDQPTLVAFYRQNCGACHDLFDGYFGERLPARVIAVQVPPADGVELTESDLPEDVYCADCVKLELPQGPVWLTESPLLVGFIDGKVACVSTEDFQTCIEDASARATAQFAEEEARIMESD
ncbi:MAG: hypothetical protein CBB69_013390 [Phycisphaera sp. TMED9]|nr:MAG: hypothetical protein CBB69_013390 [Phycisphaera sp. TMED9]